MRPTETATAIAVGLMAIAAGSVALAFLSPNEPHNPFGDTEEYNLWGKTVKLALPKDNFPTDDEIVEMDKDMPGCQHGWFESNGLQLHYRKFLPSNGAKPKAILVFLHGIQDHSGIAFVLKNGRKMSMALMVQYCNEKGYALYALDMAGHGFSEGYRMLIPTYEQNRDDLVAFSRMAASEQAESTPLFVMGHSYGGAVAVHAGKVLQDNPMKGFGGIILLAPAINAEIPPQPMLFILRRVLAPRYPTWIPFFMPNPVPPERIWRDEEVKDINMNSKGVKYGLGVAGQKFCLGTGAQMLDALRSIVSDVGPSLSIPFCTVHGTDDFGVMPEGSKFLHEHAKTPKEDRMAWFPEGAYHDLLGDPVAEETMEFVGKFMEDRIAKMNQS